MSRVFRINDNYIPLSDDRPFRGIHSHTVLSLTAKQVTPRHMKPSVSKLYFIRYVILQGGFACEQLR